MIIFIRLYIVQLIKKIRLLRQPDLARQAYIEASDERQLLIRRTADSVTINTCLICLWIAFMIASFYNTTVAYTVMGMFIFIWLVRGLAYWQMDFIYSADYDSPTD